MDPAFTSLFTIAGSGIAAYYGAYFKKRGEDKAMEDGFAEVLRQTTETTKATKDIEAKISNQVWDRQKQWELKRDILLEAIKRIAALDDTLDNYKTFVETEKKDRKPGDPGILWSEPAVAKKKAWSKASTDFDETRLLADAICSPELKKAFDDLGLFTTLVAAQLAQGNVQNNAAYQMEVFGRIKKAKAAIRREMGVDLISRSSESSAAPNPARPNPETK